MQDAPQIRSPDEYNLKLKHLSEAEKTVIQAKAREHLLAYLFLDASAVGANKLKSDLKDSYTTKHNKYPTKMQEALHYIQQYTQPKTVVPEPTEHLFVQRGGNGGG